MTKQPKEPDVRCAVRFVKSEDGTERLEYDKLGADVSRAVEAYVNAIDTEAK